jgi:hypothetical protein
MASVLIQIKSEIMLMILANMKILYLTVEMIQAAAKPSKAKQADTNLFMKIHLQVMTI